MTNDSLQQVINDGHLNCVDLFFDLYRKVMVWIMMVYVDTGVGGLSEIEL